MEHQENYNILFKIIQLLMQRLVLIFDGESKDLLHSLFTVMFKILFLIYFQLYILNIAHIFIIEKP